MCIKIYYNIIKNVRLQEDIGVSGVMEIMYAEASVLLGDSWKKVERR